MFVNATTINAAPFNTNFSAIQTAVNSIDNSNVGASGLFASQLLPTTLGQATFGGAIGYLHLAPSASTTPLTVSGVAGQSADIFDVTLTSGGAKALFVSSGGRVAIGSTLATGSVSSLLSIGNGAGNTNAINIANSLGGTVTNIVTDSANAVNGINAGALGIGANGTPYLWSLDSAGDNGIAGNFIGAKQIAAGGALNAGMANGDVLASRSATNTGMYWFGSSAGTFGTIDFNINNASAHSVRNTAGYSDIFAGVYHNVSDETLKTNIQPISGALPKIAALTPVTFAWTANGKPSAGFTAQDVQAQFPDAVITDSNGTLLYAPTVVLAHLVQAFNDYVAGHP